jgi:hypothetical protein
VRAGRTGGTKIRVDVSASRLAVGSPTYRLQTSPATAASIN